VRSGEVGAHRLELSERLVADLDATWGETISADLGIPRSSSLPGSSSHYVNRSDVDHILGSDARTAPVTSG
jgi:hypothetical protein